MRPRPRHREPWHHGLSYPLWGAVLGLGAPVGLLLVRSADSGHLPTAPWIMGELSEHHEIYAYLLVSTCGIFALFGAVLGRREDRLETRSLTDPLTRLANRGYFQDRLSEELARASRYGSPLSLLLIDLDRLKVINDTAGHQQGDQALRAVGSCIAEACRSSDFAARLGGDEFAILAPSTTAAQAFELAQRVRSAVRVKSRGPVSLSVSVGIAENTTANEVEGLVARADEALYSAKALGRDGVAVAEAEEHPIAA